VASASEHGDEPSVRKKTVISLTTLVTTSFPWIALCSVKFEKGQSVPILKIQFSARSWRKPWNAQPNSSFVSRQYEPFDNTVSVRFIAIAWNVSLHFHDIKLRTWNINAITPWSWVTSPTVLSSVSSQRGVAGTNSAWWIIGTRSHRATVIKWRDRLFWQRCLNSDVTQQRMVDFRRLRPDVLMTLLNTKTGEIKK
jgi:hypothetical protein